MNAHRISLEQTGHFSKLFLDYINEVQITNQNESAKMRNDSNDLQFRKSANSSLSVLYKYSPSIDSFEQAIKDISSFKFNRKLLVEVITEQYAKTSNCQLPTANCQLLLQENTYTVCTGHQLCLFTGPLYFIYKIISTIRLAEELNLKSKILNLKSVFVPVYWMASEDHDFSEVNHINLFGKKIEWAKKPGGPVGKFSTVGIEDVIAELKAHLQLLPKGGEMGVKVLPNGEDLGGALIELFENAYIKHSDYSSATRYLVNELFGKYGLVILDADDKRLKNEFSEIIRDDIFNHSNFKLVNETIARLKNNGYDAQVLPREINFFLLSKKFRGWIEAAKVQSEPDEWSRKLETEIERFSPSVITRPLYQQKILPNLAYVGGPAEISYWLEYKAMFDHHKIFFPALIPRNFVHINDKQTSEAEIFAGELQERHDNFIPFYLKYGKRLFDDLKSNMNPFDFRFTILSE